MKLKNIKNNFIKFTGFIALSCALVLLLTGTSWAWPTESQWIGLVKGFGPLADPEDDANGSRNVVPNDGSNYAAYINNDGTYLNYRIRLDADPTGTGGQGYLQPYGWGFELDTNLDASNYEWIIIVDGISQNEVVSLRMNTEQKGLGDPSDIAELVAAEYPIAGNHRISLAPDTCVGDADLTDGCDDPDYFLDFRIPYAVFLQKTQELVYQSPNGPLSFPVTEDTLVRYFVGSSSAANALVENGADLVGGSSLYEGLTNYYVPEGEVPNNVFYYNGSVRFVDSLDGFADTAVASAGQTLYLRVDDADLTLDRNPSQTVVVEIVTPGGDREYVTLSATGVSGKFTGAIDTEQVASVNTGNNGDLYDGMLQLVPDEIITVTYVEPVAADLSQDVSRTDSILITATATDLALTKTVDTSLVQLNDIVQFSITVENKGPNDATNLTVTDLLPTGFSYIDDSATQGTTQGSYASGTGIWAIGNLTTGTAVTLTIDAQVTVASGTLINSASITALAETDAYAANDTDSATVYVGGTDIRISKSVDNDYPAEGELITFTITALNLGPNDATVITVTDLLPPDLAYDSTTGYTSSQGTYDDNSGLWTVGNLANGVGATLTIPARPKVGSSDKILTNTANLTSVNETEINSTNDSASVDIKINFHDLELTKQVGVGPSYNPLQDIAAPNEGDDIRYVITVTNNGPNNASEIEVTDSLPAGVTFSSVNTISQGSYDSSTGIWALGDIDDGESAILRIDATVDNNSAGQTIINTAIITGSKHLDDVTTNNDDTAIIKVDGTDLMLVKVVDNPVPTQGGTVTYTLTMTNNGPNPATNIEIIDILPTGVDYSSHSASSGTSYDGSANGNPSWVWDIGDLAVTSTATLTITATVDGNSGQTITNVAMITNVDQEDPNMLNNVSSATISIDGTDLEIIKSVDNLTPNENQDITYSLVVTNHGPTDATGVQVKDLLPPEVTYQSVTLPAGDTYDPATGIWTVGSLPATVGTNTAQLEIVAQVKSGTSGLIITNNASIHAVDQGDQNTANDISSVDVAVAGTDLSLTKTVNGLDSDTPGIGSAATYLITITNNGANGATGIEVEDILPSGITYISDSPSQGSYSTGTWLVGSLAGGASATLSIVTSVDGPIGVQVVNTASIIGFDQADDNSANDSDSADITPVDRPVLTILKSASGNTATPGDVITYTVTIINTGSGDATNVIVTDHMSPYTAWQLDYANDGLPDEPFSFSMGASGLTPGIVDYSVDGGTSWGQTPTSGNNALAGYDGDITNWMIPMSGTMPASGSFTLHYKVMVK